MSKKFQMDLLKLIESVIPSYLPNSFSLETSLPFTAESLSTADLQKPGVYIIHTAQNEIIYVGKANKLRNRINSHLKEFHQKHQDCPVFWQVFFGYFKEANIELYFDYILVEEEIERQIIELFAQKKFHPLFEQVKDQLPRKNPRARPGSAVFEEHKRELVESRPFKQMASNFSKKPSGKKAA